MNRRLLVARDQLVRALTRSRIFARTYRNEDHFEADVWKVLWRWANRRWPGRAADVLLTSRTSRDRKPGVRDGDLWDKFKDGRRGPRCHGSRQ
jgi:hypothetical protein